MPVISHYELGSTIHTPTPIEDIHPYIASGTLPVSRMILRFLASEAVGLKPNFGQAGCTTGCVKLEREGMCTRRIAQVKVVLYDRLP